MDLSRILYLSIVLAFVILTISRSGMSIKKISKFAGLWAAFIFILFIGYTYMPTLKEVFNKVYANLVPGYVIQGDSEIHIIADQNGHFMARAEVDGVDVLFLVDTGATNVSLTWTDAKKLGISPEALHYTIMTETANGIAWAAPIKLKYVQLGDIIIQNVSASIGKYDNLKTSLLGMSFLEKLKAYGVSANTMIMTGNSAQ